MVFFKKNKQKNKPARIGIDARFYGPPGKGLGRYAQEIVDNILERDKENQYVIFLNSENYGELTVNNDNVEKILTDVRWYTVKEQLIMPFLIWKKKLDLIHFPHFNVPVLTPTKFVVTIHDLILTKFPTPRASTLGPFLYKIKNSAYKITINTAVKRAEKIFAVSEFTKKDIMDKFNVQAAKIKVTYEGVAENFQQKKHSSLYKDTNLSDDKKMLLSYNIKKDFFLYVGNAYPHKNLEKLLDVFNEFNRRYPDKQLVLVGKEDYFYKRLKEKARKDGLWTEKKDGLPVVFAGYVKDEDLRILYKNALAYVFPSMYEGFGLPPLEAMANNCLVLSSDKASMPEILGEAAIYFNPEKSKDILDKLEKAIHLERSESEKMKEKGKKQVEKYSWQECARETHKVYISITG
ncbi:MAG: glycosyltransferase family 4 protein [Patescibacteria group bacterium]